ncbi:MAG: hypothetical protein ACRYF0_15670 [Janthinobacterium lividum]
MKKLSFIFLAALALGSCKKNDDNSPSTPSKTDLLTAKSWRITADKTTTTVGTTASTTTDDYATSPACERDNFIKFNTNKTASFDEGSTKCSTTDPQTTTGSWDFNSDGTKLILTDPSLGGIALQQDILELTATTLRVRYTSSFSFGGATETDVQETTFTAF